MNIVDAQLKIKELLETSSSSNGGGGGGGTSLVSYYIPDGGCISSVSQHITQELGTAANIKSKTTRKDVQGALRSIQANLKGIKTIPQNGLAIFASSKSYV